MQKIIFSEDNVKAKFAIVADSGLCNEEKSASPKQQTLNNKP